MFGINKVKKSNKKYVTYLKHWSYMYRVVDFETAPIEQDVDSSSACTHFTSEVLSYELLSYGEPITSKY